MAELRRLRRPAAGVMLDCLEAGPGDGPLVFLLHGFPELAWSWETQIAALARAGFHVVAPDQRGYGESDKPRGVGAYRLDVLAHDIAALASDIGRERFDVVGHDWGGVVAWRLAFSEPDRVRRLAILNAPHPLAFATYLTRHPAQVRRSAYIGLFQLPVIPEAVLGAADFLVLARSLQSSSREGVFGEAELARYRHAWRQPGAMTAMLDWYRAIRRTPPEVASVRVAAPTLILWGLGDEYLEAGLAEASLAYCDDGRLETLASAGHWLVHEEPAAVSHALTGFLTGR